MSVAELHTAGLQHFGEVIAQRMELIEVLAARFNNDLSRIEWTMREQTLVQMREVSLGISGRRHALIDLHDM